MTQQINKRGASRPLRIGACICIAGLLISAIGGCQWPPPDDWFGQNQNKNSAPPNPALGDGNKKEATVTHVSEDERSDIIQVANFLPTNPWLVFDPLEGKIDGIKTAVYLGAPVLGTEDGFKGFFGDGTIIVQLFSDVAQEGEKRQMKLAHTWELPPAEAYKYRAKKMMLLGWGYGLRLRWPSELDLSGKRIAVLVRYRRKDGVEISSSKPIEKRVPMRGV